MRTILLCLALLVATNAPRAATPGDPLSPAATFARLQSLEGVWEGTFSNGRKHRVTYRMTAGGTVLVETWSLAPGRESMTMYHLDNDALVATHYCPAGNQPTLELRPRREPGFVFEFRSATNLGDPKASHQHRFEVQLRDATHFWRSETYLSDGDAETEAVTYTRVAPPPSDD